MKSQILFAGAAALALAACGETESADEARENAALADQDAVAADATVTAELEPQAFAGQAAASSRFEIESAQLAQEKANDQAVKDFAAMMIEDHTALAESLREAAAQANPPVTIDPQLNTSHRSQLERLRDVDAGFDAIYLQQQVAAHERAVDLMREQADGNGPFADFAAQAAAIIEQHLERARQLADA